MATLCDNQIVRARRAAQAFASQVTTKTTLMKCSKTTWSASARSVWPVISLPPVLQQEIIQNSHVALPYRESVIGTEDNKESSSKVAELRKNKSLRSVAKLKDEVRSRDLEHIDKNSQGLDESYGVAKIQNIADQNKHDSSKTGINKRNFSARQQKYQSRPAANSNEASPKDEIRDDLSENPFEENSKAEDVADMPPLDPTNRSHSTIIGDKPNIIDNTDIEGETPG